MNDEIKTGDFVMPGDFLATAEEFIPNEGVYEEDNGLFAAQTGIVLMDVDSKKISVHPKTDEPPVLEEGDIVVGRVSEIRGQIANVEIGAIRGREDREVFTSSGAVIHISKISDDYVEELEDELKPADIIRARVISVGKGSIKLSTVDENLGVLVALCSECRAEMEKEDSRLKCPNCGNIEQRKITNDYRQGIL